ncbi:unnamed protein product [Gulo gulo]|uniref:Nucleoplasmin-2 n=1 Tax=Gulo gulo TaxID=48420 RepID=A0A9X9M000_GULGU|nr:unnamed protein product [Gulo gulo]
MNLSSTSSASERAPRAMLWGCELNQEKRTCTVQAQKEGKQDCKLLLSTICLGEKAKEEMNLVEILPPACQEDKKTKPVTIASLQASVLPMVVLMGLELSPPVTFQLRAGSGPVFLSGQERYSKSDPGPGESLRVLCLTPGQGGNSGITGENPQGSVIASRLDWKSSFTCRRLWATVPLPIA